MVRRNLVGSDSFIVLAILLHIIEGCQFLAGTPQAYGCIPMAALLTTFHTASIAGTVLIAAALLAAIGQWCKGLRFSQRTLFLLLQWAVLLIEALGSLSAFWGQAYADQVLRAHWFIFDDQYWRVAAPIAYWLSFCARMRAAR